MTASECVLNPIPLRITGALYSDGSIDLRIDLPASTPDSIALPIRRATLPAAACNAPVFVGGLVMSRLFIAQPQVATYAVRGLSVGEPIRQDPPSGRLSIPEPLSLALRKLVEEGLYPPHHRVVDRCVPGSDE